MFYFISLLKNNNKPLAGEQTATERRRREPCTPCPCRRRPRGRSRCRKRPRCGSSAGTAARRGTGGSFAAVGLDSQGCGIKGFIPTSVIQGNPLFAWGVSLWNALFVVSQKWSFPTALDWICRLQLFWLKSSWVFQSTPQKWLTFCRGELFKQPRFMVIINRARRRRKFLEERRKIAQRVYSAEAAVEEMKSRLAMPAGHRLVGRWAEAQEAEAATRVQNLWRSVRAKKKLVKLVGEQQREEAVRRLQTFARRRRQQQMRSPLVRSAVQNPMWRPIQEERIKQHENDIVKKRKEWSSLTGRGLTEQQLKSQADEQYQAFLQGAGRWRYDVWRNLLETGQVHQMISAVEGKNFDRPPPYGACSAFLLKEAEEKHRQRVASTLQVHNLGEGLVNVESRAEEEEADALLRGLESELGYDFSLPDL